MASFSMPDTFPITVRAACPTPSRTEVRARRHNLVIDEPPARNGSDMGATPLETLLASFLGCTNVIANMIAEELGIVIVSMELKATAHFDTRGVFDRARVTEPFPRIDLFVTIVTDAEDEAVSRLKTALAERCPVSVILRGAGSTIVEEWTVVKPAAVRG